MTPENYIKAHLAARAHRDGGSHGGTNNMFAVAFVMRNRQRAGWHGGDWMQIIEQADKVAGTLYPPSAPNLRDIPFRVLLQGIDDVYSGLAVDGMTEGALFYAELDKVHNKTILDTVIRNAEEHPRVAQVGNVVFFK